MQQIPTEISVAGGVNVPLLPGSAFKGFVVHAPFGDDALVGSARKLVQTASVILTLRVVVDVTIFAVLAAVAPATAERVMAFFILNVILAAATFGLAVKGVQTKNGDHCCAPSEQPCCCCFGYCPGHVELFRNLAYVSSCISLFTMIMSAAEGQFFGTVLNIFWVMAYSLAAKYANDFLKALREDAEYLRLHVMNSLEMV